VLAGLRPGALRSPPARSNPPVHTGYRLSRLAGAPAVRGGGRGSHHTDLEHKRPRLHRRGVGQPCRPAGGARAGWRRGRWGREGRLTADALSARARRRVAPAGPVARRCRAARAVARVAGRPARSHARALAAEALGRANSAGRLAADLGRPWRARTPVRSLAARHDVWWGGGPSNAAAAAAGSRRPGETLLTPSCAPAPAAARRRRWAGGQIGLHRRRPAAPRAPGETLLTPSRGARLPAATAMGTRSAPIRLPPSGGAAPGETLLTPSEGAAPPPRRCRRRGLRRPCRRQPCDAASCFLSPPRKASARAGPRRGRAPLHGAGGNSAESLLASGRAPGLRRPPPPLTASCLSRLHAPR
jgi:hypothetical protein